MPNFPKKEFVKKDKISTKKIIPKKRDKFSIFFNDNLSKKDNISQKMKKFRKIPNFPKREFVICQKKTKFPKKKYSKEKR